MSFSFSKAAVYGVTMMVALAIGLAISGSWSGVVIGAASVAGGVIGALVFGFMMRRVSVDVAGATTGSVEAAIRGAWALRSFKRSEDRGDGSVRYHRGVGILGDEFTVAPTATGVTLTGPASILSVVKRKTAGR
ncbi:MAG: hypothetical protein QM698_15325 [Micropepsaceae bacterium]